MFAADQAGHHGCRTECGSVLCWCTHRRNGSNRVAATSPPTGCASACLPGRSRPARWCTAPPRMHRGSPKHRVEQHARTVQGIVRRRRHLGTGRPRGQQWLARDRFGWRHINEPFNLSGEPLTADNVCQHIRSQRPDRGPAPPSRLNRFGVRHGWNSRRAMRDRTASGGYVVHLPALVRDAPHARMQCVVHGRLASGVARGVGPGNAYRVALQTRVGTSGDWITKTTRTVQELLRLLIASRGGLIGPLYAISTTHSPHKEDHQRPTPSIGGAYSSHCATDRITKACHSAVCGLRYRGSS